MVLRATTQPSDRLSLAQLTSQSMPRSSWCVAASVQACCVRVHPHTALRAALQMYQKIWARVKTLKLDDDDETACNEVNAQFSDKELRFLMARNRSKCAALSGSQLGLRPS